MNAAGGAGAPASRSGGGRWPVTPRSRGNRPGRAVQVSKRLSLVLRHRPDSIGITLDEAGWVDVEELLTALGRHGLPLSREELELVVATSDKQRFAFDETGRRIRANQGHSVPVELGYAPATPPAVLYHGTPSRSVPSILQEGLRRGARHHVHLSPDVETARRVGQRRGPSTVLTVDASGLAREGATFYLSANGVWLVDAVPPERLAVLRTGDRGE
ncbi:MAG TPA: RNA 2'-phosphotransferase [Actinomycetales bacterium]|nr:RNA 2'-phosphotransferase [Actinomycetales bacterium]